MLIMQTPDKELGDRNASDDAENNSKRSWDGLLTYRRKKFKYAAGVYGSNRLDHQDSVHVEHGTVIAVSSCLIVLVLLVTNSQKLSLICHCCLQQTRDAEDAKRRQKRKTGRPRKSVVNEPIALLEGIEFDYLSELY